jgi:ATP-dependent protease ClpP protease subunit
MAGFQFNAKKDQFEIDIFGDIGESWFSEGHTMNTLRNSLAEAKNKPVIVNVSSLGGDVNDALVMHDLLRSHTGNVTTNVMGLTASAGTIVALGGDSVRMSENALFLVHNSWTISLGNSKELRETADTLDKIDDRLVSVYRSKTGKEASELLELMAEERWLDAEEAKEWGFVDELYTPAKAAASAVRAKIEELKGDERLPALPDVILNKENEMADEKNWLENLRTDILNVIRGVKAETEDPPVKEEEVKEPETETPEDEEEEPEIDKEKEIEVATAEAVAEKELELEEAQAKIAEINAKLEENEGKLAKIQAMVDRLQAKDIAPAGETEINPQGEFSGQKSPFDDSAAALRKEFGNY